MGSTTERTEQHKKEILEAFKFARLSKFPKKNLKIEEVYAEEL